MDSFTEPEVDFNAASGDAKLWTPKLEDFRNLMLGNTNLLRFQ